MSRLRRGAPPALILVAALLAAGCGAPSAAMEAQQDGVRIRLAVDPATPSTLQPATIRVRLTGRDGAPVEPVRVAVAAQMPGMTHTPATIVLTPRGRGDYEGSVTFEMAGTWEIALSAGAGAVSAQRFTVSVKP